MADLRTKYMQITRKKYVSKILQELLHAPQLHLNCIVFWQGMKPFVIHTRKVRVFLHKGKYRCHSRLQEVPLDCWTARMLNANVMRFWISDCVRYVVGRSSLVLTNSFTLLSFNLSFNMSFIYYFNSKRRIKCAKEKIDLYPHCSCNLFWD